MTSKRAATELRGIKLRVGSTSRQQFRVGALFDDASSIQHEDAVRAFDGGESMCDDEGGTTAHYFVQRRLYYALRLRIQCRGRLIQNQNRRVLQYRASNREALALSSGQQHAVIAYRRVKTLGQRVDEFQCMGASRRISYCHRCGFGQFTVSNIATDRIVEQRDVLRH